MKNFYVALCLLGVFGSMVAVPPAQQLAAGSSVLVPFVRQHGGLLGGGALAAAGCAAVYHWLKKPLMVNAESQIDNVYIIDCLDDIVAKVREFLPQRHIVADLHEVRELLKSAQSDQGKGACEEVLKILIQKRDAYNLLALPSYKKLQECSLPLRAGSQLNFNVVRLSEALQYCSNDKDFRTKFASFTRFSSRGEAPETLAACCNDFAAYVEDIKKDLGQ